MADIANLFTQLANLSQAEAKDLSEQLRAKMPKAAPKDKKDSSAEASSTEADE
jgi:DNA invertase Pin-like site-specific DNA recombinase